MSYTQDGGLRCDMTDECDQLVTMIDIKGWAYCTEHGLQRRYYVMPCRKLRPHELNRLKRGIPLTHY